MLWILFESNFLCLKVVCDYLQPENLSDDDDDDNLKFDDASTHRVICVCKVMLD